MKHLFFSLIFVAVYFTCIVPLKAQEVPRDLTFAEFQKDIMQYKPQDHTVKFCYWLPLEFWDVYANNDPTFQKSVVDLIKQMVGNYTIVIALDGERTTPADYAYKSYDDVAKELTIVANMNDVFHPLVDNELSDTARLLRDNVSPMLAKVLGDMGKGMHFYYFKTGNVNTNRAGKSGNFKVMIGPTAFPYNLPLGTLLPPKYCPYDEMKMRGDWQYCPYHGVKLDK
jgi:hypothetical protein